MEYSTIATRSSRRQRVRAWMRLDWAWLTASVVVFVGAAWYLRSFVTDDAWITVRYAENLANGYGFVWNPGGEPTEGFSHPLIFLAEALAHLVGASAIGTARVIGVASGVGLLLAMHRLAPSVVGRTATRVGLTLTALYAPLALWAVGGLETLPMALATTVAVLLLARSDPGRHHVLSAGLVLATLPWLRPEGLAVALGVAVVAEAAGLVRKDRRAGLVRLALVAGLPVVSQVVLETLRLAIYGHLLPNSAIYKSGSDQTYDVLMKFVEQGKPVLLVALLGLVVARGRQRVLIVPCAIYALGSIGTLDSVNGLSRFFLPTWPQLALLVGLAVAFAVHRLGRLVAPAAIAATVLLLVAVSLPLRDSRLLRPDPVVRYSTCQQGARVDAARWLRANTPQDAVFSISDAGLVPAQSGGRTAIDQLLLNEALIQRTGPLPVSRRVNYVYGRRPDVLILVSRNPTRFKGRYAIDRRLARTSRPRGFELAEVARGRGTGCRYHLFIYRRAAAPP